jgi:antitoxin (DNA-binding transcriptional repressor) of toxin-antitoxin stability system
LKQRATQIISEVESTHEQVVVTKMGKPVALIQFITDEAFTLITNSKGKEVKKHGKRNL